MGTWLIDVHQDTGGVWLPVPQRVGERIVSALSRMTYRALDTAPHVTGMCDSTECRPCQKIARRITQKIKKIRKGD